MGIFLAIRSNIRKEHLAGAWRPIYVITAIASLYLNVFHDCAPDSEINLTDCRGAITGADPNADWLAGSGVALDEKGFVLTGKGRPLETSVHGVFAIGDVRSGSVKRVAASVGEGAQVVVALHDLLAVSDQDRNVAATQ